MLGIRFDRENGFYGKRRWSFDIDDFLIWLLYILILVVITLSAIYLKVR